MGIGTKTGPGMGLDLRATSVVQQRGGAHHWRPGNLKQNVIVNGGFDADSDWTKGVGWTISGGTANYDGTDANNTLSQVSLTLGKKYTLTFSMTAHTQGKLTLNSGGPPIGEAQKAGNYSFDFVSEGTTLTFAAELVSTARFIGSIDNVICRERVV